MAGSIDLGSVKGRDGANGKDGKSPYDAAVEQGYTGTESEFYAALVSLQNAPYLPLDGGTLEGNLGLAGNTLYLNSAQTAYVRFSGTAVQIATSSGNTIALGTGYIDGLNDDPSSDTRAASKRYVDKSSIQYGTCSTYSSTAAKSVSLSSFKLETGAIICVRFTYSVTGPCTLNVNYTGAKQVRVWSRELVSGEIQAGQYALFRYDGTYWQLMNPAGLSLDGGTMNNYFSMGGNRIMNLGEPLSSNDAARKSYVDAQISENTKPYISLGSGFSAVNDAMTLSVTLSSAANAYDELVITADASLTFNSTTTGEAYIGLYIFNENTNVLRVQNGSGETGSFAGSAMGTYRLYRAQNFVSPDSCIFQTGVGTSEGQVIGEGSVLKIPFGLVKKNAAVSASPLVTVRIYGRSWSSL